MSDFTNWTRGCFVGLDHIAAQMRHTTYMHDVRLRAGNLQSPHVNPNEHYRNIVQCFFGIACIHRGLPSAARPCVNTAGRLATTQPIASSLMGSARRRNSTRADETKSQ